MCRVVGKTVWPVSSRSAKTTVGLQIKCGARILTENKDDINNNNQDEKYQTGVIQLK